MNRWSEKCMTFPPFSLLSTGSLFCLFIPWHQKGTKASWDHQILVPGPCVYTQAPSIVVLRGFALLLALKSVWSTNKEIRTIWSLKCNYFYHRTYIKFQNSFCDKKNATVKSDLTNQKWQSFLTGGLQLAATLLGFKLK